MMAKGNPRVILRIAPITLEAIHAAIDGANVNRKDAPYDVSAWIRHAIDEKLQKLARGRAKSRKAEPTDRGEVVNIGKECPRCRCECSYEIKTRANVVVMRCRRCGTCWPKV